VSNECLIESTAEKRTRARAQRNMNLLRLATTLCLLSCALAAQWPAHKTPTPDLSATAPRSADGKPDLSGVWMIQNSGSLFYINGNVTPAEMLPWAAALLKQREQNFRRDTDGINCLPPGPKAGIGVGNLPLRIMQTPGLIAVLYEYQTIYRQIFTDGRALPVDPNPTWMGYSTGRWDGDTLVVTTLGYNDRTSLDLAGHPHTEALRLTERYRRVDYGHIDLQVTYDDPKAYARPWTQAVKLDLMPDGDLIEYVCENERDKRHLIGTSEEFNVSAAVLPQYVGTYGSGRFPAVVSLEEGRLMIDPGSGRIPLIAQTETTFSMEGTLVEFVKDSAGRVTGMIQHWNEGDRPFPRR
jgi:hypothetical protein